ncbi:MAG: DUF5009 domain-containing protein [Armatimonadetes bacterium]|nr:DUF5009 domain-containing protein [Armatimonadota bacterium]
MEKPRRDQSLDILRGLAILGMAFSGMVPWGTLPGWMYHAQLQPPGMEFVPERYGFTWVDWVFPAFLVSMGAAIPLAYRKFENGPFLPFFGRLATRFLSLAAFSIIIEHLRQSQDPGNMRWQWLALLSFAGIALLYLRLEVPWWSRTWWMFRLIGAGIVGLVLFNPSLAHAPFDPAKQDAILMVLAHTSLFGGVLWWFARKDRRVWFAFAAFALLFPWVQDKWHSFDPILNLSPLPWLFNWQFYKWTVPVAIGLVPNLFPAPQRPKLPPWALGGALVVFFLGNPPVRENILPLLLLIPALAFLWVSLDWLKISALTVLGTLIAFPAELRKDPATVPYLWGAGALAILLWALLTDRRGLQENKVVQWIGMAGQNPILAYAAITNLVHPLFRVSGINTWVGNMEPGPWALTLYAGVMTSTVLAVATWATRRKIWLRA